MSDILTRPRVACRRLLFGTHIHPAWGTTFEMLKRLQEQPQGHKKNVTLKGRKRSQNGRKKRSQEGVNI